MNIIINMNGVSFNLSMHLEKKINELDSKESSPGFRLFWRIHFGPDLMS